MPLQPGGGTERGWLAGWAGWAGLAGLAGPAVWLVGLAGWAGLAGWVAGLGWLAGWLAGWAGWAGWGEISDLMGSRRMYLDPSGSCYLLHGSSILRKSHVFMISGSSYLLGNIAI